MDQSLISVLISSVVGILVGGMLVWIKLHIKRSFAITDATISQNTAQCTQLEQACHKHDIDITRLNVALSGLDDYRNQVSQIVQLRSEFLEKFTRRGDFIREMQALANQLDSLYKKMDRLDEKINNKL